MRELSKEDLEYCVTVLKKTVEQRGISQKQLEELSHVPQPRISRILAHALEPTYEVLGITFPRS